MKTKVLVSLALVLKCYIILGLRLVQAGTLPKIEDTCNIRANGFAHLKEFSVYHASSTKQMPDISIRIMEIEDMNLEENLNLEENQNLDVVLEPKVGTLFNSEDEAKECYSTYAKSRGFGVVIKFSKKRDNGDVEVHTHATGSDGIIMQVGGTITILLMLLLFDGMMLVFGASFPCFASIPKSF
ncbi:hypothetical protein RHSIM_Rhsim12G0001300 [Rhododendron simsii]|uniref:Uncharacterized protein n=1 Tax=Rhododendron simsii TaxID=118357 RepID=A0A834G643_RHOSS|nr:hypothetical protein RHSIM_Rhsim12G0001300 [Rhododendron simsii]